MKDLVKTNAQVFLSQTTAANIMAICRVITPQFYKGMSHCDLAAEKMSIELLTSHIDQPVLRKMCELAAQNYGIARSENSKTFFDINYILTFYRNAFNHIWCDCIAIPDGYNVSGDSTFDEATRIITERWRADNGDPDIIVKFIVERKYDNRYDKKHGNIERHHTPKYWSEQIRRMGNLSYDKF